MSKMHPTQLPMPLRRFALCTHVGKIVTFNVHGVVFATERMKTVRKVQHYLNQALADETPLDDVMKWLRERKHLKEQRGS